MENETKTENKGKKPHRHKSYFIAPNTEQKENTPNPQNAQNAQKTDGNHSNEPRSRHNKHKNRNRSQNAPKQEPTAPVQSTPVAADNSEKVQNIQPSQSTQNPDRNRRNKNKHRKHSENPAKDFQSTRNDPSVENNNENTESEIDFPKIDRLEKTAQKKLENFSSSPEFQKYKDYEEFTYDQIYGSLDEQSEPSTTANETEEKEEKIESDVVDAEIEVVGIRFKASGKTYYFAPNGITLRIGSHAIVETARGLEYGEVVMSNTLIPESETVPPLRSVVRAATQADTLHNEEIKKLEESAFRICNEKIIAHELDMKLIDAQYTFDNSKLLFYFTSSGRVDFRELVKDLASVFRTRIELRQIGIRDEAKMVGGLGMCGRPLCCSKFLTDFGQVSIKMAKEQNLSLNATKISGICGRLMCCLRYEHDTYEYEIKRTPPVDTLVRTVDGVGTVTEISPLRGTIKVRLAATPEVMPKSYRREEVTILKKKN